MPFDSVKSSLDLDCRTFGVDGEAKPSGSDSTALETSAVKDLVKRINLKISDGNGDWDSVKFSQLTEYGKKIIEPILEEFVHKIGPDLAKDVVVQF